MPTTRTQLTVAQAAALLGCSVRTLERAIARGEYAVTHDPRGVRLVDMTEVASRRSTEAAALVDAGEQARAQAAALAEALQSMAGTHQQQVTALTLHLDREREQAAEARAEAGVAREEAAGARRECQGLRQSLRRRGWVALAAALALVGVCVSLTHTHWQAEIAAAEVRQVRDRMTQQAQQLEVAERTAAQERLRRVAAEAVLGASQVGSVSHTPWWEADPADGQMTQEAGSAPDAP